MPEESPDSNGEAIDNPLEHERPVKALLRLTETAAFLRSTDGRFYARVQVGGRPEIYALRSPAFRAWLIDQLFPKLCGEVASDWSIRRALAKLEATARFEGGTPSIFTRVGHEGDEYGDGSACYLDLADAAGRAIRIGSEGWSVVDNPPVHFRRRHGHLPLPMPSRGGSIELLRPYVNVSDDDFRLLVVWLAAALRPVGPYPILVLYAEHGAAKTTTANVLRLLIDPRAGHLPGQPRNTRALMVSAANRWVLAYDNITAIPDWLSDGLCLLATGGTFEGHASSASDEESVIHAQRPLILTGIEEFVARADLGDRCVFLNLPPITTSTRRLESEFWASFQKDYPRILGALLDAVAGGLRELPSVRLTELPRMADFAVFAEAVGRALGWPADSVLSDYNDNRRDAALTYLEDSPLTDILLELAPHKLDWVRTASDLLAELTAWAGKRVTASPRWPKSPLALSRELRRIAPQMRMHGVSITFLRTPEKRFIEIISTKPPIPEESHVSVSGIESCSDELIHGDPDAAQIHATA